MAEDTKKTEWGAPMAREEHKDTYTLFLSLTKWVCVGVAAILLFLVAVVY